MLDLGLNVEVFVDLSGAAEIEIVFAHIEAYPLVVPQNQGPGVDFRPASTVD